GDVGEHDRDGACLPLQWRQYERATDQKHTRFQPDKLDCGGPNAFVIGADPAIFNADVLIGRPTELLRPLLECVPPSLSFLISFLERHQRADEMYLSRLLCARRERPRGSAAEQRDELAPFQLIELHSVPSQGPIAGYRISEDQSGGVALAYNEATK